MIDGPFGCQLSRIQLAALPTTPVAVWKKLEKMVGKAMIEMAKMIGMTPAALTLSGRKLRREGMAVPAPGLVTRLGDRTRVFRLGRLTVMIKKVHNQGMMGLAANWWT